MKAALLPDRGVVGITGDKARDFLQGLLTADTARIAPGRPAFAALLTPQGKILVDGIVVEAPAGDGFLIDCPRALARTLVDRLAFYRLRARLVIEDLSERLAVVAVWDGPAPAPAGAASPDPRLAALGARLIVPADDVDRAIADLGAERTGAAAYEAHRIALGVPRGGMDFIYGDAFPHETDMDQLDGVDFAKGCYVGQEVVSRMQHRGSARSRVVPVAYEGFAPEPGEPVMAGEKTLGTFGSSADGRALALVRLDRAEEALAAGTPLVAGGATLRLVKPEWARFPWPGETKAAG